MKPALMLLPTTKPQTGRDAELARLRRELLRRIVQSEAQRRAERLVAQRA